MIRKFLFVIALLFTHAAAERSAAADRPNIVLFIGDDFSWHDSGAYGATDVKTPNIDALAKESMKFDQAFAASPTCTPSRSAILTGMYPVRNGCHANHSLIKDGIKTWPAYFKALGYRVAIAGKTHFGPREQFDFEYVTGSNFLPTGKTEVLYTEISTPRIDNLLSLHDKKKPLCLIVATHSPHVFWWLDASSYDPANITLPPYLADTKETRAARTRYYADVANLDKQLGEVRESLAKHGLADSTMVIFTADQGAEFPFAKWNLYDAGIRTPLLVHWPGHVKAGTTTKALVTLIDLLPTTLEAAGGIAPPTDQVDARSFLPVLLGKSDKHRNEIFGVNTGDKDMNRAPMRCIRTERFKYILNLTPEIPFTTHITKGPGRAEYWQSWVELAKTDKNVAELVNRYEKRPAEELYDVAADPYELNNLATDPAYAKDLAELREKLKQWRIQQGEDLNKVLMPEDARTGELRYAG